MPQRPRSHSERQGRQAADQRYEAVRQSAPALERAQRLRNSGRWKALRKRVLAEQPLCADPYGVHAEVAEVAREVDHIVGLHARPDLAFVRTNLQGLCSACHSRKSQEERVRGSSGPGGARGRGGG